MALLNCTNVLLTLIFIFPFTLRGINKISLRAEYYTQGRGSYGFEPFNTLPAEYYMGRVLYTTPGFLEIRPRGADEKYELFGGHVKFKITPRGLISRNALKRKVT